MRKEEGFKKNIGSLFSEAYDLEETPLMDSLRLTEEHFKDFEDYKAGGLKRIQLCHDCRSNRRVAMATLKDPGDHRKKEAFVREAKLNAALQHPNIVPVYEIGLDKEEPWFTMKFIAGRSLDEVLDELSAGKVNQLTSLADRLDVFVKICDAIAYAHSLGVLHLDLKPENIRINNYGDVVICDWGLADVLSNKCDEALLDYCSLIEYDLSTLTVDGVVKGTPGYMAPEQTTKIEMRKGTHTDVFSLGAILYTLLTNKKAFTGSSFEEVLDKTSQVIFPRPSEIVEDTPLALEAVCLKAMSLQPEDRYSSVEELQKEILSYRNGFATEAENASTITALKLLLKRHKIISYLSLVLVIFMSVLAVVFIRNLNLTHENALRLAEKLQIEKEYNARMNKDAAPLFLERAKIALKAHQLADSLNFCTTAVELDKSLAEAWAIKGQLHFIREEYTKAIEAFEMSDGNDSLLALAKGAIKSMQGGTGSLSIQGYLNIMRTLYDEKEYSVFGRMIHQKVYSDIPLADRLDFLRGVLLIHNSKGDSHFFFSYDEQTKHLDISDNHWLKTALCLQNFPAESLDISNTLLDNCIGFRKMPLKKLDISNTRIVELHTLENNALEELNIAYTGIPNLGPINSFKNLKKLNVSHSGLNGVIGLKKTFPNLQELTIHKGQFTERHLAKVAEDINLIVVD